MILPLTDCDPGDENDYRPVMCLTAYGWVDAAEHLWGDIQFPVWSLPA